MAKYKVPEGGLKAAHAAIVGDPNSNGLYLALEAFIRWQSENPVVPGDEQCKAMQKAYADRRIMGPLAALDIYTICCVEFQRIMYLAHEPAVPETVKDLLGDMDFILDGSGMVNVTRLKESVKGIAVAAYRLGKECK